MTKKEEKNFKEVLHDSPVFDALQNPREALLEELEELDEMTEEKREAGQEELDEMIEETK